FTADGSLRILSARLKVERIRGVGNFLTHQLPLTSFFYSLTVEPNQACVIQTPLSPFCGEVKVGQALRAQKFSAHSSNKNSSAP
ncbi:MAG: hypothetical protein KDC75_22300, partial [Phaeodactylibacter sp.]|nr:hypothetical protein [Phaeodactylibacter sp.]